MKKYLILGLILVALFSSKLSNASQPSDFGLKEGDLISAIFSDDPDVYIVNEHGYKRLFLNPEIFKFYGHLGGFFNIKLVTKDVIDLFPTSGLFRDCENNDQKVYGVDISGEDSGQLHWVNTTGEQAVKDDLDFFKKVFCINNKEFTWYPKGDSLNTVKDVPDYERKVTNTHVLLEQVTASSSFKDVGKVIICHNPQGNPSETQTITVDVSAIKALLASGDTVGPCLGTALTPNPTPVPLPTPSLSVTPTPMSSTSVLPSSTPILNVTVTPIPSQTASLSYTPTPTPTPTSSPQATLTPTPIITATATSYATCGQNVKNVPTQYSTIQSAIDAANLGDTVRVAAGTYNEKVSMKSGICLEGAGIDQTIITKSGDAGIYFSKVPNTTNTRSSYMIVKNLTVKNSGGGDGYPGVWIYSSSNVKLDSCRITGNNNTAGAGGVYIGYSDNITLSNCLIDNNYSGIQGGGVTVTAASPVTFNDLTVANNTANWCIGGVYQYRYDSSLSVNNSILWGNSELGSNPSNSICTGKIGSTNFAVNSSNTNSSYIISSSDVGGWSGGTDNISVDPQFVSSTDFHLKSTSSVFNMGVYPLTPTPTPTSTPTPTPTPGLGSSSFQFSPSKASGFTTISRNLTIGSTGDDVKQLQALLVNEVGYSADLLTGYFGRITRDAVIRLQEKYGIKPTYGYFGEITRRALNALISNY